MLGVTLLGGGSACLCPGLLLGPTSSSWPPCRKKSTLPFSAPECRGSSGRDSKTDGKVDTRYELSSIKSKKVAYLLQYCRRGTAWQWQQGG